jgi:hypothetical protein
VLPQITVDVQTSAGRLRLTLQAAARRSWAARFSTVCPLSVALGLRLHPLWTCQLSFPGMLVVRRRGWASS